MRENRPDYLNCVMTTSVIRGVQERQRAWDKEHPEEAEKIKQSEN